MALAPAAYLLASVAIGVLQVADAFVLVKFKNRFGVLTTIFSIAEYVWAVVSYFAWRAAEASIPYWLPASFIAYVAAFFVAAVILAVQSRDEEMSIPTHLVVAGGIFGIFFATAAVLHVTGA